MSEDVREDESVSAGVDEVGSEIGGLGASEVESASVPGGAVDGEPDGASEVGAKAVAPDASGAAAGATESAVDAERGAVKPNALALLPIAVFLVFFLGCGIYYEYIAPIEGQMGFYVVSVVVAFCIALAVALVQNRKLTLEEKIHISAQGIGDDNIVIMLFIFLIAGGFSGIASAAGGTESMANMLLNVIPASLIVPGFFFIGAVISLSMGTSVGTISVLVPIVVPVAKAAGIDIPFAVGAVVGGAMFGDNLSFISDTTIAATRTQGVRMQDKFIANLWIALPAALIALVVFFVLSMSSGTQSVGTFEFNFWLALPYFLVLIASICGINVFIVLGCGVVLFFAIGLVCGTLDVSSAFLALGSGTSGMFETMVVAILVAAISALVRAGGGFASVLGFIRRTFKGRRGGMLGVGFLSLLMDVACANNTVAIVVAGPIAKEISDEYGIEPRQTASLLDIFSCVGQGVIPYGAQLLVASSLAGIAAIDIVPWSIYQGILLVAALVSIAVRGGKTSKRA